MITYRKPISFPTLFMHLVNGCAVFFLNFVSNQGEPYGLALVYALSCVGVSPLPGTCFYIFSGIFLHKNIFLLYIVQSALLYLAYCIQKYLPNRNLAKTNLFSMLALSLSLGGFLWLSPFTTYPLPIDLPLSSAFSHPLSQKAVFAVVIFLLSACFTVAEKALLRKLLKCRLRNDELLFCFLLYVLVGIGICRSLSVNAYMGMAFFILLTFSILFKNAETLLCAFLLGLPPMFTTGVSLERFFLYGVILTLFMQYSRLSGVCALLLVFFGYGYFDGMYALQGGQLASTVLSALLPSLFFMLFPTALLKSMENKLVFYREKHLSRIAINRNRSAIGKKLFEISAVFREIESTFSALGTNEAEQGAKEYIRGFVLEKVCKNCSQYRACMRKNIPSGLDILIDVGCVKGKTSLLDLPRSISDTCTYQNEILSAVNSQLGEYKKYMLETENAATGRILLANQARGVSEILRNLALEQSEPLSIYTEKEKALTLALLRVGIVSSEVLIYGDRDNLVLSLITFGKVDLKKVSAVASHVLEIELMLSEKIALSQNKFCCILRKKPYFDAAFGVASICKNGQYASGDTHSVIKIDERHFLVALSDGMGSGEYARKISESTISLLESFYRAQMPSPLVLSTINKLLTFSKEETFACVDIAVVDLDNGEANIVKIGSPAGFILSGSIVKVLEGNSLPLGILDSLSPDVASYTLSHNDFLLFLSDGITDAFGSVADLYEVLKTLPATNPQNLADDLLQRALHAYGDVAKDDMTVIAVRLFNPAA